MSGIARPAVFLRYGERLHQMPSREIGTGDVADLAARNQRVQSLEGFFDRSFRVETMHVIDVDEIGAQAPQAGLAGCKEMMAGGAEIVRAIGHAESGLGRDQDLVAAAGEGFPQNLFGQAFRVNIRRVEQVDARFQADVHQAGGFGDIACSPGSEKVAATAKGAGTEAELRNLETGITQLTKFHKR